MIVTINHSEIKQGVKGDYLYIKYVTDKGKPGGKAVFSQLKDKWGLCGKDMTVILHLDEKYNVIDIEPVETPPPQPKHKVEHNPEDYPGKKADDRENKLPPEKIRAPISEQVKWPTFSLSYAKDIAVAGISSGQLEFSKVGNFTKVLASSLLDWLKDNG